MLEIVDEGLGDEPVMHIRLIGAVTMEESRGFFDRMAERDRHGGIPKVFMIWDSTEARMPSLEVLKAWADWSNENKEMTARRCHALVHVIPNAAVRGALKFTSKLAPMPCPVHVTRTLDDAKSLVAGLLAALPDR